MSQSYAPGFIKLLQSGWWAEQFGLRRANSARRVLLSGHVREGKAARAEQTRALGQFINGCDIRIKFVGTAQQIGHSSTDLHRTWIVGNEK